MRFGEEIQEMLWESFVSGPGTEPTRWFQDGLRFACQQCGNCCSGAPGYVWVYADEIRRIAAHLGLSVNEFGRRHVRQVGARHSLLERPGGDCEFLERVAGGKTRCQIHEVRPVQCRTWPFWGSNLTSAEEWEHAARGCPGIGRGERYPLTVIQAALKENGQRPL